MPTPGRFLIPKAQTIDKLYVFAIILGWCIRMEYSKYRIFVEILHLNKGRQVAYQVTMEYGETGLDYQFQVAMHTLKGLVNAFLKEMARRRISVADSEFKVNEDFKDLDLNENTAKFIALLNEEVKKRWHLPSSKKNKKGGQSKKTKK